MVITPMKSDYEGKHIKSTVGYHDADNSTEIYLPQAGQKALFNLTYHDHPRGQNYVEPEKHEHGELGCRIGIATIALKGSIRSKDHAWVRVVVWCAAILGATKPRGISDRSPRCKGGNLEQTQHRDGHLKKVCDGICWLK